MFVECDPQTTLRIRNNPEHNKLLRDQPTSGLSKLRLFRQSWQRSCQSTSVDNPGKKTKANACCVLRMLCGCCVYLKFQVNFWCGCLRLRMDADPSTIRDPKAAGGRGGFALYHACQQVYMQSLERARIAYGRNHGNRPPTVSFPNRRVDCGRAAHLHNWRAYSRLSRTI